MGFIDFLKGLVAERAPAVAEPVAAVEYQGFYIQPDPLSRSGQFQVQAWITRDEQRHHFIRADLLPSHELCVQETLRKARVLIDQQGSALFK